MGVTNHHTGTSTRRAVLAGAGAAGVAAAAGCEGTGGGSATTASGIRTRDIPVGGGKIFPDLDPDGVVVTQPAAGRYLAFSATCTHRGCTLQSISHGTINCPCHGARYSITDGSVVRPGDGIPAETHPLPPKTVTVSGDRITVS